MLIFKTLFVTLISIEYILSHDFTLVGEYKRLFHYTPLTSIERMEERLGFGEEEVFA